MGDRIHERGGNILEMGDRSWERGERQRQKMGSSMTSYPKNVGLIIKGVNLPSFKVLKDRKLKS